MLLRIPHQNRFLLCDVLTRGRRTRTQVGAGSVRAEKGRYERVGMENAGAYRLIDKETGEKVIVWGGADDADDEPIPSSHVLSWRNNGQREGTESSSHESVVVGFGRLKTQKVKSLIKKSTQLKKEKYTSNKTSPLNENINSDAYNANNTEKPEIRKRTTNSNFIKQESNEILNNYEGSVAKSKNVSFDATLSKDDSPTKERDNIAKSKNSSFDAILSKDDSPIKDRDNNVAKSKNSTFDAILSKADSALRVKDNIAKSKKDSFETKVSKEDMRGWGDVSNVDYFNSYDGGMNSQRKLFANDSGFFSKKSFKNIGCSDDMIDALRSLMFVRPSHIQAMAFRPVLEGKSCIIADQSGSGKTLAYLAPIIQGLRQAEALGREKSSPRCPKIIVLAPTSELASQVLNNCRSISKSGTPFRSMVATGGFKQKTQLDSLKEGIDVLIATPGRFLYLFQEGYVRLSDLKCVVLDEVDILYGEEGFEEVVQSLIRSAPLSVQYLFVTATLPLDIYNKVVNVFPDCEVVMGPGMHRTSPGLEEVLVDCSGADDEEKSPETAFNNKKNALLQLLKESPVPKTIVFCNKIESCRKVENVLKRVDRKEAKIRVLSFHAALTQDVCKANMKEFLKAQSADSMFLVCTDRASRGIDFEKVDHVVLFDFPREPSEYVRRVGRTARGAGGVGMAFVFVVGKQVTLAKKIMERNRKGHPLHDVPGAYETF
ncbi:hypothetical protein LUZ60_015793 [Juncus effusus]|nr:hypothetical protein LUZ60_015793 [Juncus effusus]